MWSAHCRGALRAKWAIVARVCVAPTLERSTGVSPRLLHTALWAMQDQGMGRTSRLEARLVALRALLAEGQAGDAARSSVSCFRIRLDPEAPITRHAVGVP